MTDDERDELLIRLSEQMGSLQEDVGKLAHVLIEGNGQPPLLTTVAVNTEKISRLEMVHAERKIPRSVWATIIVSVLLSIISIGFAAISSTPAPAVVQPELPDR